MLVECTITAAEQENMVGSPVPIAVQIRCKLNAAGFRFKDDGKFSAVTNESPAPLGVMSMYTDAATGDRHYKQKLEENK